MARRVPHQHFVLKERRCILPNAQCASPITKTQVYTSSKSVEAKVAVPLVKRVSDLLRITFCALVIVAGWIMVSHWITMATSTALIHDIAETVVFVAVLAVAMIAYKKFHGIRM